MLSNIQELREMLLGQGIKLDKIDVHVGGNFNQTFSDLHEGAEKDQGSNHGETSKELFSPNDDDPEGFFASRDMSGHDSMVDFVA